MAAHDAFDTLCDELLVQAQADATAAARRLYDAMAAMDAATRAVFLRTTGFTKVAIAVADAVLAPEFNQWRQERRAAAEGRQR